VVNADGPDSINPIETGYGGFVKLHKPFFIGRDEMVRSVLNREREVVRFKIDKKGAKKVRRGNLVAAKDGTILGVVTSSVVAGNVQIGLALIKRGQVKDGDPLLLSVAHETLDINYGDARKVGNIGQDLATEEGVVLPRFPPRTDGKTTWH